MPGASAHRPGQGSCVPNTLYHLLAVAAIVEIKEGERLTALAMDRLKRIVPLLMQGFFEATRLGMTRASRVAIQGVVQ